MENLQLDPIFRYSLIQEFKVLCLLSPSLKSFYPPWILRQFQYVSKGF